jgi:hypothetical protein
MKSNKHINLLSTAIIGLTLCACGGGGGGSSSGSADADNTTNSGSSNNNNESSTESGLAPSSIATQQWCLYLSGGFLNKTFTFSSGNKVVVRFDLVDRGYVWATKSSVGTYSYSKSGNEAVLKITTQWYDITSVSDWSKPNWKTSSGTETINLKFNSKMSADASIKKPNMTIGGYTFSYVQG